MNIPTTKKLCDAERFIEGLKLLAAECNLTQVEYNYYGPLRFIFDDGSSVGSLRAYFDSGYINEKTYKEKWNK